MKGRISDEDIYFIRIETENGKPALQVAEDIGYVVDKNLALEIVMAGIDTGMIKNTTAKISLKEDDARYPNIGMVVRNKVFELYGDDTYQLISVAHRYPYRSVRYNYDDVNYVVKIIGVPVYMRNIIYGIGLNQCHTIEEIKNFRLDKNDERIRAGFEVSSETKNRRY